MSDFRVSGAACLLTVYPRFNSILLAMTLIAHPGLAKAETHAENITTAKNSACSVRDGAGEFANVDILKNGRAIFHLNGSTVTPVFSPSGKYIAFTGNDMDSRAFEGSRYLLLIYNCDRQVAKGYEKVVGKHGNTSVAGGEPYLAEVSWNADEKKLSAQKCQEKTAGNGRIKLECKPLDMDFAGKIGLP